MLLTPDNLLDLQGLDRLDGWGLVRCNSSVTLPKCEMFNPSWSQAQENDGGWVQG